MGEESTLYDEIPASDVDEPSCSAAGGESGGEDLLLPLPFLPRPEAPRGADDAEESEQRFDMCSPASSLASTMSIGKFICEKGSTFSSAIAKRITSSPPIPEGGVEDIPMFFLSGRKVIVEPKSDNEAGGGDLARIKGQVSFFSRSNCRDCCAVRSFLRDRSCRFVEINVDVYPEREAELVRRTGGDDSVPKIFMNEKLLGGIAELNALRKGGAGGFERAAAEMAGERCPESAPAPPAYGFDAGEEEGENKGSPAPAPEGMMMMAGVVKVVRQKVPIRDRWLRMRMARNCFAGSELVEAIIDHLDCGRRKAVEMAKHMLRQHIIHHVFRERDFEDANLEFYRFLEHDPAVPNCFNISGESINDADPKSAAEVGERLTKLMVAILESYASEDRRRLDLSAVASSEEFRRYVRLTWDLQRLDITGLSEDELMAFFMNLYNAMAIHATIRIGRPSDVLGRTNFFSDFMYMVGGYPYSLGDIKNGILRSNRREPYSLSKPFNAGDRRLELALPKMNRLIHFGLSDGSQSSPIVRFFSVQGIYIELRDAAKEFFVGGGVQVDLDNRTVYLTRIIKWYAVDFGEEKDLLRWIVNYLDATKAGLLMHLMRDRAAGPINIVYQDFDWS